MSATQTDATRAPTYVANAINGAAAVRFDGDGKRLQLSSNLFAPGTTPQTIFTVFSSSDYRGHIVGSASASPNDLTSEGFALGLAADKPFLKATTDGSSGVWLLAPADLTSPSPRILGARVSDTESELISECNKVASTAMPEFGSGDSATIGGSVHPAEGFAGDIAEILVYNRWLTDEELSSVRDYLNGRYNGGASPMADADSDGTFDLCDVNSTYIGADAISVTLEAPATLRGGVVANITDAPSALSFDPHTEQSHVWGQDEPVSLLLELDNTYYIEQMHFWNFTGEGYDVDEIKATFYNEADAVIKEVTVAPQTGFESILAEDFAIDAAGVSYIRVVLSATNNEVEFQNLGFSGWVEPQQAAP